MTEAGRGVELDTPKYRVQRRFYDRVTGRVYDRLADIPRKLTPDPDAVRAFLRIGYVPGTATLFEQVDCLPGGCRVSVRPDGWDVLERFQTPPPRPDEDRVRALETGARLFVDAVQRETARHSEIVVPLSGGMDSRAILAALLEVLPAWKLNTYTHGTRGANDFELGNLVARRVGTRHVTIDLDDVPFSADALVSAAIWSDANTDLVQPAVWHRVSQIFGTAPAQWTGFTGDGLGGSHYRAPRPSSDREAVEAYLNEEAVHYDWVPIAEPWTREAPLVATQTAYDKSLGRHEAVWFDNHVERYTTHHIFMNALSFVNPFMDDAFASFMLSLPAGWRADKRFFDEMIRRRFPKLFRLPTKGEGFHQGGLRQLGWRVEQAARKAAWRVAPSRVHHPMMSYLDFGAALRHRPDVAELAADLLHGLARRSVVDGREVLARWDAHRLGRADHRYVLTLLMSLEVALRVFSDSEGPRRAPSSSGA